MKKSIIIAALALLAVIPAEAKSKKISKKENPPVDIEQRIDNLISQMTLEEKVGQLNQLSGYGYAPEMIGQVKAGMVGSILNEVDPVTVNKLQKVAVEESRLGIPLVFARDVIHGFKTIFPIPLGQAATWNPSLIEEGARIAANEATAAGVRWTFSPMVDVSRDARWGRIAESAGEDPYLNSVVGVAMVKGYQGDDLSNPRSMAACVKHFAGYGASESGLDYNTTYIPDNLFNDVYLKPYKACADAGAATFMCSFNDINGIPSSGNRYLLRDLLRNQWGWNGLMCSDWNSVGQMVAQGYAADLRDAARIAADAGVDFDMESYSYIQHLKDLVEAGEVDMAVVDDLVRNVLRLKFRLGLFDNPYVDEKLIKKEHFTPANLEAARRAAAESAILLTNNGVLPLDPTVKKVAVIGPMADARHDQNGTWCFDLEKDRSVTPLEALKALYGDDNVLYSPGLSSTRTHDTSGFARAKDAASRADVVLYFCGEEAVLSGEAHCLADITLAGAQSQLLELLHSTGKPVVMVIMTGRPMAIYDDLKNADAVLYTFHGGTMAGPAIADLLTGVANPSGRLPVSLPMMSGQEPFYYNRNRSGRPATEVQYIADLPMEAGQTSTGCTSFYLDAGKDAAFPFGFGRSYTTFAYSNPRLSTSTITPDGTLTVACDVTNTGAVAGAETVQCYVGDCVSSRVRPERELRHFEKVMLQPGETRTVEFTITPADLAFYTAANVTAVEPGQFKVWMAPDCISGVPATFEVK